MNALKLIALSEALAFLAEETDTSYKDLIDALSGVCFDEEEAGQLKQALIED